MRRKLALMRLGYIFIVIVSCAESLPPTAAVPNTPGGPEPVQAPASTPPVTWPVAITYPSTKRVDITEQRHGQAVADPYRWLESLDEPEVQSWAKAQDQLTTSLLERLDERESIRARMAELMRSESYGVPVRRKKHAFWRYSDGQQEQPVIVVADTPDAAPKTLIDFNQISKDGQWISSGLVPSADGALLAYGMAAGGGDWQTWRIRDLASGADLPDELKGIKYYRPVFAPDGKSIYYSRFPEPAPGQELVLRDEHCKLYKHRLGTASASDVVVYERADQPTWQFRPKLTHDGRYLVLTIGDGEVGDRGQEQIVYFDLQKNPNKPIALIDQFDAEYLVLGNEGPVFYFQTTLAADTKRIIAIDTRSPARAGWREIVPAGQLPIDDAALIGHQLLVSTLRDAHSVLRAYDLNGKLLREAQLPGLGTVGWFEGGQDDKQAYYLYTSFTEPRSVYSYDLASGTSTPWKLPNVPFDRAALETRQVFYPGKDAQMIPMFIVGKRGSIGTEPRPMIVSGYGSGGVPSTPWYDAAVIAWLERGGLYAVANVRGGGEYGEVWHRAGAGEHKQVSVDDFRAAARWLSENGYTSARQLGATGTSGGGILVSAAALQEPALFGAFVPIAGVYDLLRFQLFGEGAGWAPDFPNGADPAGFRALLALSPLHTVRAKTAYPPALVVTSDHDVRVAPLHSFKLAASLQAAQSGAAPQLLRIWSQTGHGRGSTLSQRIEQNTEVFSFFAHALQLKAAK